MKKTLFIIAAFFLVFMWSIDCRQTGDEEDLNYYVYHRTPSPSVTPTRTVTPMPTSTPTPG